MMRYDDQKTVASIDFMDSYADQLDSASLSEAIAAQPPPPCDGCEAFPTCATYKLACKAFFGYTMFPSAKHIYGDWEAMDRRPSAKIFAKTFRAEDLT